MHRIYIALVMVCALATTARADDRSKASEHARRAVALYQVGRYQDALDEFEAAYVLYPTDTLLFNLAQTHRRLDHCRKAVELYTELLKRSPDSPRAASVQRLLPSLEKACLVKDQDPRGVQPPEPVPPGAAAIESAPSAPASPPPQSSPPPASPDASAEATVTPSAATASRPRMFAALSAGGLAGSRGAVMPLGAVAGATWSTRRVPFDVGFALAAGAASWHAGGFRGTSADLAVVVTGGRSLARGRVDLRVDGGVGVLVLTGISPTHPLLAAGRHLAGGIAAMPALEITASGERDLGHGWRGLAGIRAGFAYRGDFGGGLASFAAQLGIGRAL